MEISTVLEKIKESFHHSLPSNPDARASVQSLTFIAALLCGLGTKDTRFRSLACLRRTITELTNVPLSRGGFWERLATRKLNGLLYRLLITLMNQKATALHMSEKILGTLGVRQIFVLDSTSVGLPSKAAESFPAPRHNVCPAAVKAHGLIQLFTGATQWFELTPATTHDRKAFPPLSILAHSLILFDLGYWDYQLLREMSSRQIFFLSRVKTNAAITLTSVGKGIPKSCIGYGLHSRKMRRCRGSTIEAKGILHLEKSKESLEVRIIGFWNEAHCKYHWYLTNLTVKPEVIYPLYRLRWQQELHWKSWKSSLCLDEINSANQNIIHSLLLASMCASLMASQLSSSLLSREKPARQRARSLQRASMVIRRIGREIFQFISGALDAAKEALIGKLDLFKEELYDPNYKNRPTSIDIMHNLCLN